MRSIYLIECEGWVKVGYATDILARISAIQVGNPFPCTLLASWAEEDHAAKEAAIHTALARLCPQRGEWFEIENTQAFWLVVSLMVGRMPGKRVKLKPGRQARAKAEGESVETWKRRMRHTRLNAELRAGRPSRMLTKPGSRRIPVSKRWLALRSAKYQRSAAEGTAVRIST